MAAFLVSLGIILFGVGMLRAMGSDGRWSGVGIMLGGLLSAYVGATS